MKTPIVDFLNGYVEKSPTRMHMPGHKGKLGYERDITEVAGADSLYHADGIICESERYAGELFSAYTYFSAEGSSLSIRAMLYLASLYAKFIGKSGKILAARNVHKSFISAAALVGIDVDFFGFGEDYLSAQITPEKLAEILDKEEDQPIAVYITSPDYLGRMQDIKGISEVCHKRGILLLVDNAHGAYLAFLEKSMHPIALGADMCADSAHKTLPALTGAAYLHISRGAPALLSENAKSALALFGSTSPSYLILESLDRLNALVNDEFKAKLCNMQKLATETKAMLSDMGYKVIDGEALKITIDTTAYGYRGYEIGKILEDGNLYPEFYDADYLVLMLSADNTAEDLRVLTSVMSKIPKKAPLELDKAKLIKPCRGMSIREAMLAPRKKVKVEDALGNILADGALSCPPAVPILVSGEIISESAIKAFKYYGYDEIYVIK
jgi:arginine/lysine/ornithine decarboxylase